MKTWHQVIVGRLILQVACCAGQSVLLLAFVKEARWGMALWTAVFAVFALYCALAYRRELLDILRSPQRGCQLGNG